MEFEERLAQTIAKYTMPGRYCVNDQNGTLVGFSKRADAVAFAFKQVQGGGQREVWTKPFWAVATVRFYPNTGNTLIHKFDTYGREQPGEALKY